MAKRGRTMRRADRHEQLLKIACQLVAQEGISALTMTALSELAAVAKPVVYSHFDNAEHVAIELLDQHFTQLIEAVSARVAGAQTLEDYVSWMVDGAFDFENTSDTPVRKITNGFSGDDAVNRAFLRHELVFRTHWQAFLSHSGVPEDAVEVAAYAMSNMISNTVYTYALKPQQRKARETLKTMLLASIEALAPGARMNTKPDFLPLDKVKEAEVIVDAEIPPIVVREPSRRKRAVADPEPAAEPVRRKRAPAEPKPPAPAPARRKRPSQA
jgi:AcrR family transcriptional regulator